MMKKFLVLILCALPLIAFTLKEDYTYERPLIMSNDLFPDIPKKFEIVKIPDDKTLYRLNAQIIAKTFELHALPIDTAKVRYVTFTKKSPIDFTPLKHQLEVLLRGQYPTIVIDEITITPRGFIASIDPSARAVFDEQLFRHPKGTFYVIDSNGIRRYLDYSIKATISALHTNQKILRRENLSGFNTQIKQIPYQSFKDTPLTSLPTEPSRFRANLRASQLITQRDIEMTPYVLKNEKVIVQVANEGVIVEFGATATQEGSLYDIITIQKRDGKRAKAKVIGEKRVELQ
jgi:flagellar basal body P-ring formation protein FlgA